MPRNLSFWLLIALVAALGVLLFQVVKSFVLTIFIAIILAVLFTPTHEWLTHRFNGRERIAALVTTLLVLLLVLLPIGFTLLMAGTQIMEGSNRIVEWFEQQPEQKLEDTLSEIERTPLGSILQRIYTSLPSKQQQQVSQSTSQLADGFTAELYENTRGMISNLFAFIIGVAIMALSLYYFLADRAMFLTELHKLLPMEFREEKQFLGKLQLVCRSVVFGTVVAGLVQSVLAGIAYAVVGVPQLWFLIVLTMFCSMIPVLGTTIVWLPVAVMLFFNREHWAAIGLVVYGAGVIGPADNLVRAYVIGNQTRLHPLVVLVTVLGALEWIGLWGIFLGPMIAACFYALLDIIRDRMDRVAAQEASQRGLSSEGNEPPSAAASHSVQLDTA